MVLRILSIVTDKVVSKAESNEKIISITEFNQPYIHPFIATNKWERIEVELSLTLELGYIKEILSLFIVIPLIDDKMIMTERVLLYLIEIYPSHKVHLRKEYFSNKKDTLKVKDVLDKYELNYKMMEEVDLDI